MRNTDDVLAAGASATEPLLASTARSGSFESTDGTRVSFLSIGCGPAVIVIPGALSMAADYGAFARALAERFTVHIIERRGRGLSGPQGDDYSIVKELNDVLALQASTGARFLVGHSFGGLVALEAARRNEALAKVAVYEPAVSIGHSIPSAWMRAYEMKLAEGKDMDAFVEFAISLGPDRARTTPRWLMKLLVTMAVGSHERRQMFALLAENLREHREVSRLDSTYENYREVSAGVLVMYGGRTGMKRVALASKGLAEVLSSSETKEFPRLDHFGIDKKAPQEVARTVSDYFRH